MSRLPPRRGTLNVMLTRIHLAVLPVVALAAGCSHSDGSADARDPCPDATTESGMTLLFAFSSIQFDTNDHIEEAHFGFDLDDRFYPYPENGYGGCDTIDWVSAFDVDQNCDAFASDAFECALPRDPCTGRHAGCTIGGVGCRGGVDNVLWAASNTLQSFGVSILDGTQSAFAGNREVILLEVRGVDSFEQDDAVGVRIVRAFPTFAIPCDSVPRDGEYQIDRSTLHSNASSIADAVIDVRGAVVSGRLQVRVPTTLTLPFRWFASSTRYQPVPLDTALHSITLRFDLTADRGERGNFGAWIEPLVVERWVRGIDLSLDGPLASGIVSALTDIDPRHDGHCGNQTPPELYQGGGISIGFGFELTRAHLHPTSPVADAPSPGTCAAPMLPDAGNDE
jgi:hypothetical protein